MRKKSQAYLFGTLKRTNPSASEEDIRKIVDGLRWVDWPELDLDDEPTRAPIRGREPMNADCWGPRVAALVGLLADAPQGGTELIALAKARLRWPTNFAIQVVAASEELGAVRYRDASWSVTPALVESHSPPAVVVVVVQDPRVKQLALFSLEAANRISAPRPKRIRRPQNPAIPRPAQLSLLDYIPRKFDSPSGVVPFRIPARVIPMFAAVG